MSSSNNICPKKGLHVVRWAAVVGLLVFFLVSCKQRQKPSDAGADTLVHPIEVDTTTPDTDTVKVTEKRKQQDEKKRMLKKMAWGQDTAYMTTNRAKQVPAFKPEQMLGEWVCGTLHEVYRSDGSGTSWDTSDDVLPEEGLGFTWKMGNGVLIDSYKIDMGGLVPDVSIIVKLDSTQMLRRDYIGRDYLFLKVR